jgi:precorrin-2/cobalt-factor-2 C20-methyltransferase
MSGRLYGLGLGPGDPELITMKALRLLRAAPVIAYPAPEAGNSFARAIVAPWLDGTQCEIAVRFPMRPGPPPVAVYREAAARLLATLDGGVDVAYLCQGDPLFYGSFAGILRSLPARCAVTVVPGVSALNACAAAAGLALSRGDCALSVIPATVPEEVLTARLERAEAAAVIKLGRHFRKLRRVLDRLGRLDGAVYVAHASLPDQHVAPLAAVDPARVPYFATALVGCGGPGR